MKKIIRFLLLVTVVLSVLGAVGLWRVYTHYAPHLPDLKNLTHYRPSLVTRVYARDYQLLGEFFLERREFVPRKDIPEIMIQSFLAIEDSRFYYHFGIDPIGIARAAVKNLIAGRIVEGASTITQQVAKNFLLSSERTIERKIKEWLLSYQIERSFSKDEILELYLNQIYLGSGAYGVGAAARTYFDLDVSELSLGQMALLAGLPKSPSKYNPWRHPVEARKRQALVLQRMVDTGYITQDQALEARRTSFRLARPWRPLEDVAPHYLEHVRRAIRSEWGSRELYRGGLDIYTTLDPRLQRAAQWAVREGLAAYDERHGYRGPIEHLPSLAPEAVRVWLEEQANLWQGSVGGYLKGLVLEAPSKNEPPARVLLTDGRLIELPFEGVRWARKRGEDKVPGKAVRRLWDAVRPGDVILVEPPDEQRRHFRLAQEPDAEAALVGLDPHSGQILALVGGYDFGRSEFNRATQSNRQPGSAFKPFIFAAALESGFSPVSRVDDTPMPIPYRDSATGLMKTWSPQNYERDFHGPTTLRVALAHSRNLVTLRLMKRVGIPRTMAYLARFGFYLPRNRWSLPVALGAEGFPPLAIASAYGAFANGGKLVKPVYIARVQDRFGRSIHRHSGGDCLLCHQEPQRGAIVQDEEEKEGGQPAATFQFGQPVISRATAYQVTSMLKEVIESGTGTKAQVLNRPLAGKTGTTNDTKDAWFLGFSHNLVTAVWVGYDDNSTLGAKETGARAALPIWIAFMGEALKYQPVTDFPVPPEIRLELVDAESGEPARPKTKRTVLEAFKGEEDPNPLGTPASATVVLEEIEGGMY